MARPATMAGGVEEGSEGARDGAEEDGSGTEGEESEYEGEEEGAEEEGGVGGGVGGEGAAGSADKEMLVLLEGVKRVAARSKALQLEPYRPKAKRGVLTVEQKIRRQAKKWEDWVAIT